MTSVSDPGLTTQTDIIKRAANGELLHNVTDSQLAKTLSMIYFLIGLRPKHFPTVQEDKIIFNYIRERYGKRTLDELYLAFDLAINEKLDVDDVRVYDQFSIQYLSKIMNGYHRYAFNILRKVATAPNVLIDFVPTINDAEKMADITEFLQSEETKILPLYLFNWFEQLGLLTYNDDEKTRFYKMAILKKRNELENELLLNSNNMGVKYELEALKKNIRENFRDATDGEISAIYTEYKKIILLDKKREYKLKGKK